MSATPVPFAAALFVGGRSTRMGEDKAALAWRGRTLLDRQLDTLRALHPARLFLSVRGPDFPSVPDDVVVVPDPAQTDCGPLGGLLATLERCEAEGVPRLLVLAVDMPRMTADRLRLLLDQSEGGGAIPELEGGRLEPLAALWPASLLPEVRAHLAGPDTSFHRLARCGIEAGKLRALPVPPEEEGFFLNVNRKSDWDAFLKSCKA